MKRAFILALAVLALGGCIVGPKYTRPAVVTPTAYKEPGQEWKLAAPSDAIAKGTWWEIYGDTNLNALEIQAFQANQGLKGAFARLLQSRDVAHDAIVAEIVAALLAFLGAAVSAGKAGP